MAALKGKGEVFGLVQDEAEDRGGEAYQGGERSPPPLEACLSCSDDLQRGVKDHRQQGQGHLDGTGDRPPIDERDPIQNRTEGAGKVIGCSAVGEQQPALYDGYEYNYYDSR